MQSIKKVTLREKKAAEGSKYFQKKDSVRKKYIKK